MANTFANLDPAVISAVVLTAVGNKTAFLKDHSTLFENVLSRRASVAVPLYGGSTTLENPTNFNQSDATATKITVTPIHLYTPFSISLAEYGQFHQLENQLESAVQSHVNKMQAKLCSVMTTGNYSVALSGAANAFDSTSAVSVWGQVPGEDKNLLVNSVAYSKILPTSLTDFQVGMPAYGFSKVAYCDAFTGATSGVWGFVCTDKKAIAIACGLPELNDNGLINSVEIDLGNGARAQLNTWYDLGTRTQYGSIESMMGVAVGDANAGKLLKA
jgi:hypothetical protein